MSGPPYPPPPVAGSAGIGQFVIGVSPIGDIAPFDYWRTVISQYANSPRLTAIIQDSFETLDQTKNLSEFYDHMMNVLTADGYGLDVWGRIVGVSRILQIEVSPWFGFSEQVPGVYTFGQGSFYSGSPLTQNFSLADQAYRLLIMAKAAANITDGSIAAINQILMGLFPNRGNAYVQEGIALGSFFGFAESTNASGFNQEAFYDGGALSSMEMSYVFDFPLSLVEIAIVQQSGVLPKSTGVRASVVLNF